MVELTGIGKALVVLLLFRLLFAGYLIGLDQFHFNDIESALTVLLIYGLIGIFAALFLLGKRYGLTGIIGLGGHFPHIAIYIHCRDFRSNSRFRLT